MTHVMYDSTMYLWFLSMFVLLLKVVLVKPKSRLVYEGVIENSGNY